MEPLRQFAKDRHNPIIGQYECSNIFMNIDEIIQVTEEFYRDLISDHDTNLGNLCSAHVRISCIRYTYAYILYSCVSLVAITNSYLVSIMPEYLMKSS